MSPTDTLLAAVTASVERPLPALDGPIAFGPVTILRDAGHLRG